MHVKKREEIFRRFASAEPSPTTELIYSNPFQLLVAVILSAQTTDKSVNLATKILFKKENTPKKILALGQAGLERYVKSIGLFRTKAKHILTTCQLLLDKYHGDIPQTREELEKLPGVGRKTANVILNTVFGQATIAVDTHIFRVANRTGIAPGKNVLEVELKLQKFISANFKLNAHNWLILHGRYVCKARKPECGKCLISDLCEYPEKSIF